jgi:hypothetical protein
MAAPTLQQIRDETDNDPKTLGYATLKVQTDGPSAVAAKMNEVGASAETLFKAYVPMEDVLAAIVLTDYTALAAASKTALDQFTRGTRLKSGDANMRTTMAGIFPASTTRTNLINMASRSCSRAEALWGEGVTITATQVADALAL